ncbi:MAG: tetratricopeptide repeat protein [Sphingobacteriales bacterium]|nr:tetratricopeptide repeat protein [Sphingobacteriales bacterium]
MSKTAKICAFIAGILTLVSACTDHTDGSASFDELLVQPPYAALTDSIKKEPQRDELYFRRAIRLNADKLTEPALADFRKAWSLKKNEQYALGAGSLLLESKPAEALVFLKEAVSMLPESLLLNLTLARSYDALGKTEEALQTCNRILDKNPEQVDVLKMKADLLGKKGSPGEALSILEKAYSLTPYDVELNYILALKYAESKNPQVLQLCDSLSKADSLGTHAEPYYYKGIYYSNINDNARALSFFDAAVKHDYYFLDGYIEKGALLFELKKYKEALDVFNLALTISPKFADTYYWIAKCQQALGQRKEAKLNYQRAFGLDQHFTAAKDSADKL